MAAERRLHPGCPLTSPAPCPAPLPACRYELHSEFEEALDHALDRGKNTKIMLLVSDVGVQY